MSFRVKVGLEASCLGTGEMARWVKSLVWNHEDLSFDLQSTHTVEHWTRRVCNPSALMRGWEVETGLSGSRQAS